MAPWVQQLVQGGCGVGCIALAFLVFRGPEMEAPRYAIFGFGMSLLGNTVKGPNQMSVTDAKQLVAEAVRTGSVPPAAK